MRLSAAIGKAYHKNHRLERKRLAAMSAKREPKGATGTVASRLAISEKTTAVLD
jgi:hypothetical protein